MHSGISWLLLLTSTLSELVFVLLAVGQIMGEATSKKDSLPSKDVSSFWWSLNVLYLNFILAWIWSQMVKWLLPSSKLPQRIKSFFLVQYDVGDFHIEFVLNDEICPCVVAIGHCGFNGGICGHWFVSVWFCNMF